MIILATITDKIRCVTGQAVTVDSHVSYTDLSGTTVTPGKQNTNISTATTTDICNVPGASTYRNVKTINVRNRHASSSCDITITYDANGTVTELYKVTLRAGETLEYVEGVGFFLLASLSAPSLRTVKLTGDQSNSTTSLTEVTGMSLTTGVGTFVFNYHILHQSAATTTGIRFSVNHTGTVTAFVANVRFMTAETTATATQAVLADQDVVTATGGLQEGFAARAKSTTGWGTSTGVDTANSDMLTIIEGLVIVTADGDIELWHGSEVAAASTVKAGSSLVLTRTDP